MCLAIPGKIVSINARDNTAVVSFGEVKKEISLALVEDVAVDDYVIVHVGFALQKLDAVETEHTLRLMAEAGATLETSSEYKHTSRRQSLSME